MMAAGASMRDFEAAQAEAMELLLQQCVDTATNELQVSPRESAAHTASLMDLLAQSCEDASAMVQDMSYEDVATSLAHAISATQESLRNVRESVGEILDDPDKMRTLCQNLQSADHPLMLEAMAGGPPQAPGNASTAVVSKNSTSTELAVATDEENVRNMMAFADNMCGVLDDALSTITKDELTLAAQLSLGIAQKMLEAGQSLFVSLGDEERQKLRDDQADRITIEELPDDADETSKTAARRRRARSMQKQKQRSSKHTAALRTYVESMMLKTRERATEHPYLAGALATASLPFVGFAIPVASVVGVGLMVEKYYPEHASLTVEMLSNFVQMTKLWILLMKISARQLSVVARECFKSWYEYASTHGFVATGVELASTSLSVGSLCVSRVYQSAVSYATSSSQVACSIQSVFKQAMGTKQSKLKKELMMLKEQAALTKTKHDAEVEVLKSDKRVLEFKLNVLQELTAQAQLEAEKVTQAALESEERMKALKWELVRKLTVSTSGSSTTSSSSQATGRPPATSLAASESASPRVALTWKLRDGVALHRSSSTKLSTDLRSSAKTTRSHAQSEPAMPHKQTLSRQEPTPKSKPQDSGTEQGDARSDAKPESSKPASSKTDNNNNEEKAEPETATTALQSVSAPSSSPSSEDESRSKYPALSRKKSTQGLDAKPASQKREATKSPFSHDADRNSSSSEPESGDKAARGAAKDLKHHHSTGKLGGENKELSFSEDEASS